MSKKIVTLYIDDTSLRLLVTHGKQIKKWGDVPLAPGLVKNGVVTNEAEVAAKLKQILKGEKVRVKKVIVGISGLHCLSRPITLPKLPKEMQEEAVKREAKRVLPVPLEELCLSWQVTPSPEGETRVFLIGVPRKTSDALLKVLHKAGLKPYLLDLKPLLLARVVKEPIAVLIDVQATEFDIVIMANGVPQPIRTLPLPSEALTWQEKLPTIKNELDRTIKFYNSNNPETPLAATTPIFVSGQLANEPELCQSLSDELGYPVSPLPSPLECPNGLDPSYYMANIGLVLKKRSSAEESGPLVTNLNPLPAHYQHRPISLTKVFGLPGAAVATGLLIFLVTLIQGASADTSSIREQLGIANQLLEQKQQQRQELKQSISELEKKVTEAEASQDNFIAALTSLEEQSNKVNDNLRIVVNSLPSTISLSNISHANNTVTIYGKAPSEDEVLTYLRNLDASGAFCEITINHMGRIQGEGMNFILLLRGGG